MNNLNLYSETVSGYTAVSDLFIDEYVPSANGDFVKVYLYLLRLLTRKNSSLSISSLADTFNQTENDVMRALRYWDKSGLVCLSYDDNNQLCGITVKDLKNNSSPEPDRSRYATPEFNNDTADTTVPATAFADETSADEAASDVSSNVVSMDFAIKAPSHTVEPSKVTAPAEKLDELNSNDDFSMLLFVIQTYLGKTLSQPEVNAIVYFYDTLHFPADLIEYLIEYCVSKGKTSIRYIEKIALSWADEGINTVEAAKDEVSNHNEAVYGVMKAFGLNNREPGQVEKQLISKWTDVFCFETDMIIEACNRTMKATHQPSFEYADTILTRWHNSHVHHLKDISVLDDAYQKQKAVSAASAPKAKPVSRNLNNFERRSYDMDSLEEQLLNSN
mgnify:CR=1 FL=1